MVGCVIVGCGVSCRGRVCYSGVSQTEVWCVMQGGVCHEG